MQRRLAVREIVATSGGVGVVSAAEFGADSRLVPIRISDCEVMLDRDALPRWGKPTEVAFLAVCLASEDAGYITGQCLLANGGKYFL